MDKEPNKTLSGIPSSQLMGFHRYILCRRPVKGHLEHERFWPHGTHGGRGSDERIFVSGLLLIATSVRTINLGHHEVVKSYTHVYILRASSFNNEPMSSCHRWRVRR